MRSMEETIIIHAEKKQVLEGVQYWRHRRENTSKIYLFFDVSRTPAFDLVCCAKECASLSIFVPITSSTFAPSDIT